jgi:urea transport system substrate-binding protein
MPGDLPEPVPPFVPTPFAAVPEDSDTLTPEAASLGEMQSDFLPSLTGFLSAPLLEGELGRLAHYRILQVLGTGGMGAVFQAEDTQLHRLVALKVILPEFARNPVARERFLSEARAAAAVKNDHVVTIYQIGQDRDVLYLAMELLQGESVEAVLGRGELVSWREAVRIARETATGLAAAHESGLIHRDIKPANIFLEAPSGRVKVLDFGLARAAGSHKGLTQTGRIVGTPEFMSPEQARGDELDARSDLFSLGAVLYSLCTLEKPFQGESVMAVLTALAVREPRPIADLNPDVPPALADLVARMLDKERDNRPASALEVKEALQAIEAGAASPEASDSRSITQVALPRSRVARPEPKPTGHNQPRRWGHLIALLGVLLLAALGGVAAWSRFQHREDRGASAGPTGPPIRVGVLHSRTGTMAISERPVIDAVLLAIREINEDGGVLGRRVEAILADGESDETVFAAQAEKLIEKDKVCTIFGCWTSASRKAVVPVVERHKHLLVYPVQYEGVEESPNVVYLGPVPNQQILPALRWLVGFQGKRRWFLVGSDYVFPRTANAIIRDEARSNGCEVMGEAYLPLAGDDVAGVVGQIVKAGPDLIVNTINGDSNLAFFRSLRRAGILSNKLPTVSFSISEEELNGLSVRDSSGDYVAANYFQSLDTPANRAFVRRFADRYGDDRVISSAMQTAYVGVHLWAQAVRQAGRAEAQAIREAVHGQSYDAPQGMMRIDPQTQHTIQIARVGRVDEVGRLKEVYRSPEPEMPVPFPPSRSRKEWMRFLDDLYKGWGGRWSSSGP